MERIFIRKREIKMNCEEYVVEELKKTKEENEQLKSKLNTNSYLLDYALKDLHKLLETIEFRIASDGDKGYTLSHWEHYSDKFEVIDDIYKRYIPNEECCESEKE